MVSLSSFTIRGPMRYGTEALLLTGQRMMLTRVHQVICFFRRQSAQSKIGLGANPLPVPATMSARGPLGILLRTTGLWLVVGPKPAGNY